MHRSEVLAEVKRRLQAGEPCRLVSTQVIEAGVDVDFPVVMRAIGPLDRITQAGGRCNREGKLSRGQMIVFVPASVALPPGPYRIGTLITQDILNRTGSIDLDDPEVYARYFAQLYNKVGLDSHNIQQLRASLDYPQVAMRAHLIEDRSEPVVVEYDEQARRLISQLQQAQGAEIRQLVRQLQPYIVNLRIQKLARAIARKNAIEIVPGLYRWEGNYEQIRGIIAP